MNSEKLTVKDRDGNVYHTIKIGSQVWMVENLKTTKYQNGDAIPNVIDNKAWENLKTGGWCNYNHNSNNGTTYGRLYNWYAVNDSRELAPAGWHVPSDAEWEKLIAYLGDNASEKLKEIGTKHWESPNKSAIDNTGFNALPGANRNKGERFSGIGSYGGWWCSTESSISNATNRLMYYYDSRVYKRNPTKGKGFSVRCIKD
jgi:uncharacterized protein (TIGR02145 family)